MHLHVVKEVIHKWKKQCGWCIPSHFIISYMQPQNTITLMDRVMNYKTEQTYCILHMEGPSIWSMAGDYLATLGVCICQTKLPHMNKPLIHPIGDLALGEVASWTNLAEVRSWLCGGPKWQTWRRQEDFRRGASPQGQYRAWSHAGCFDTYLSLRLGTLLFVVRWKAH